MYIIVRSIFIHTVTAQPEPPQIITPPQAVTSRLGGQVNLTCIATGIPPPVYQWFRDDELLENITLPYLLIPSIDVENRGYYRCTASNDDGVATSSPALLALDGEISILLQFNGVTVSLASFQALLFPQRAWE